MPTLTSLRFAGFRLFVNQFSAVLFALVFLFMLVLLRVILRNQWLAMALWCVLVAGPLAGRELVHGTWDGLPSLLLVLTRGGLLTLAIALFFMFCAFEVPLTLDVSAWYATHGLPGGLRLRRPRRSTASTRRSRGSRCSDDRSSRTS